MKHDFDIPRVRKARIQSMLVNREPGLKDVLVQGDQEAAFAEHLVSLKTRREKRAVVVQTMVSH